MRTLEVILPHLILFSFSRCLVREAQLGVAIVEKQNDAVQMCQEKTIKIAGSGKPVRCIIDRTGSKTKKAIVAIVVGGVVVVAHEVALVIYLHLKEKARIKADYPIIEEHKRILEEIEALKRAEVETMLRTNPSIEYLMEKTDINFTEISLTYGYPREFFAVSMKLFTISPTCTENDELALLLCGKMDTERKHGVLIEAPFRGSFHLDGRIYSKYQSPIYTIKGEGKEIKASECTKLKPGFYRCIEQDGECAYDITKCRVSSHPVKNVYHEEKDEYSIIAVYVESFVVIVGNVSTTIKCEKNDHFLMQLPIGGYAIIDGQKINGRHMQYHLSTLNVVKNVPLGEHSVIGKIEELLRDEKNSLTDVTEMFSFSYFKDIANRIKGILMGVLCVVIIICILFLCCKCFVCRRKRQASRKKHQEIGEVAA